MFATDADGRSVDVPLRVLREDDQAAEMVEITDVAEHRPRTSDYRAIPGLQASALAVVLRALAAQVSRRALAQFAPNQAEDLTLMQLAYVHQPSDTGILGDVFELGVLRAIQTSEPLLLSLLADALLWVKVPGTVVGAFTAAAEAGGARESAQVMPDTATLYTGKRGRPPNLKTLLERATTREWRNDILLLTSEGRGVPVSLKSQPKDIGPHLRQCQALKHPPLLAMVPGRRYDTGVHRHETTNIPIVTVPADVGVLSLVKAALTTLQAAFARHLKPVGSALGDPHGVTWQLYAWRNRTVRDILDILDDAADRHGHPPLVLSPPRLALPGATPQPVGDAEQNLVIAANMLRLDERPDPLFRERTERFDPTYRRFRGMESFSVDFRR